MTKEHKDRPRQQHYDFVNHALPDIFFKNPDGLLKSVQENGDEFLNYLWGKLGQYSQNEKDDLRISSELIEHSNYYLIKIIFPQPEHDNEAFAVALIFDKDVKKQRRFFVFENRLFDQNYMNLIGEWIGENYVELAKLETPDITSFINFITSIFQTASA